MKDDLVSIKDLSKDEILELLSLSEKIKANPPGPVLKGKLMASCFFEPSTRTRLSFEAAMKRLGGDVIGFTAETATSTEKGESLHDSMRVISLYSDLIVIRHPLEGSARQAAEASDKPVINAGDGSNEHPTQTLLDLFTIKESHKRLDNLRIAFVGDLLYGRTVHSLSLAFAHFDARLYFVSPPSLSMPEHVCEELKRAGVPYSFHTSIDEVIEHADILYMTRVQKERFTNPEEYLRVKDHLILTPKILESGKKELKVLHPLPRVNEISRSVDEMEQAFYFSQAENGLYVRQALLCKLLGKR